MIVLTARELSADERSFLQRTVASVFAKQASDLEQVLGDVRTALGSDSGG